MTTELSRKEFLLGATACIKTAEAVAGGNALSLPEADQPVVTALGNGLCVVYLVDSGDQLVYVQNRDLPGTNLTPGGLHELGLHNLGERGAGKTRMQQHGPLYAFLMDGMFEASLILLDHLWDENLAHIAPNGFVVALPSRDVLAACDAASVEGISALRDLVSRVFDNGGSSLLTRNLYRRRHGNWVIEP